MKNKTLKIETLKAWTEYISKGNPYKPKKKSVNDLKDIKELDHE